MNHNFAPYELTQLLPRVNKYGNLSKELNEYFWSYQNSDYKRASNTEGCFVTRFQHFNYIRAAWTWEDILLWLEEEHKLVIDIITQIDSEEVNQLLYTYRIIALKDFNQIEPYEYYSSRQEAREQAIKECLTLIKTK